MDTSLSSTHRHKIQKKAQQRLHLLRKLRTFQVSKDILTLVYRSLIESVLTFNIASWYNQLTIKHKTKLTRIVNQAGKIPGCPHPLSELYSRAAIRKAILITEDLSLPLHDSFQLLPSGRRFNGPLARKNTYKKSFIPSAIALLNSTTLTTQSAVTSTPMSCFYVCVTNINTLCLFVTGAMSKEHFCSQQ